LYVCGVCVCVWCVCVWCVYVCVVCWCVWCVCVWCIGVCGVCGVCVVCVCGVCVCVVCLCVCVFRYSVNLKERNWTSLPLAVCLCSLNALMNAYRHDKSTTRFPLKIDLMEHSCWPEMWLGIFFTNFTCAAVWWNARLGAEPLCVTELYPHKQTENMNSNKSPTRCSNFPVYYPDVYLQLNMFRASSRPSSGSQ